jgi:D-glucosaminate PTS system EIIC component
MLTILEAFLLSFCLSLILSRGLGYASLMLRFTPMMMGLLTGIILNDIPNALKISALIQLLYLGVLAPGGVMRSEPAVAVSFAIPIILLSNVDFRLSIIVAFIFGVLGGIIYPYRIKINTKIIRLTEKYTEELNDRGLFKSIILYPVLASLALFIPVFFIGFYVLVPMFAQVLIFVSQTILYPYLTVISSALTLVGFALSIHVMAKSGQNLFFIGSFIITLIFNPFNGNIFAYGLFGLIISILYVVLKERIRGTSV